MPGIHEQAAAHAWQAGIFDFGKAKLTGIDYFNCGLMRQWGKLWLVARRSRWKKNIAFGVNDVMAFDVDPETMTPLTGRRVALEQRYEAEGFEDPRALARDGRAYVSCCDFVMNRRGWTGAHQIITEVDSEWRTIRRYDPEYGKNGGDTGRNKGHEKNWLWFFHENRVHLVYQGSPHLVVEFDDTGLCLLPLVEHKTEWDNTVWRFGEIRGGTPPVLRNGEYWTFFHSSTPWLHPRRQYHMGAYAFSYDPPFRITRITPQPLLSGSQRDRWHPGKPLVCFPCGALLEDDTWLVTGGSNDLDCFWAKIPHRDLLDLMVKV